MILYKLEKDVILFKNQFEQFVLDIFHEHKMERLSIDVDGLLFRIKYMAKHNKDLHLIPGLKDEFVDKALQLRAIFGEVMYNFLIQIVGLGESFSKDDIVDVMAQDVKIDGVNVKFKMMLMSNNEEYLKFVDKTIEDSKPFNMFPNEFFRYYVDSYNDGIAKAYPELFYNKQQDKIGVGNDADVFCHSFTFQTSENCSLNCIYCLTKGTKILMSDFTFKNIEDIKVGDIVLSFPEHSKDRPTVLGPTKVTKLFKNTVNKLYRISSPMFSDDLYISGNHPVLTKYGWKNAEDLSNEDEVYAANFSNDLIDAISRKKDFLRPNEHMFVETPITVECIKKRRVVYNFETEEHTYIANKALVHNCYQFNKSKMKMDFSTAKKFIDDLLADNYGYINRYNSPAIILEFIGGEPLLEINLTRKIYEYFLEQTYAMDHPWFKLHRLSICSNGLQYFDDEVQDFFKDYAGNISFNISIDGNKELHDACRIQPNGEGSYDVDIIALNHYNKHYTPERNSKMTLAPENMKYLFDSVVNFINNGMMTINLNCIFEEGWNQKTAALEYNELKKVADYILEKDLENLYIAIFNEKQEDMSLKSTDGNFCFREDTMILTPTGNKLIKNLREGDLVITDKGNAKPIEKIMTRFADETLTIKSAGAFKTYTTPEHPFLTKKFLYQGFSERKYGEPQWVAAEDLRYGDKIALAVHKFGDVHMKPEIAYLVGLFVGDGWGSTTGYKICCGYHEVPFMEAAFIAANVSYSFDEHRTDVVFNIFKENKDLIEILSQAGHLAHNKKIPDVVYKWDEESVKAFMAGLFRSDGHYDIKKEMYKFNTVSQTLANDVLLMMRSLKYYPTCYLYPRAGQSVIEGRSVTIKDRYEVYCLIDTSKTRYQKYDEDLNVVWCTVRGLCASHPYEVYNMTVADDHTFIANGQIVHNCGGLGSMLSLRPNGQFYPCIRYMPTSVGDSVQDLCIGHVDTGIVGREQNSEVLNMMDNVTRRSQSNDICYDCPISNDCAWCFKAGTLIETIDGPVPIEQLKIGDLVLSQDGKYNKVYRNLFRSASTKETMVIRAIGTPNIYTTEEHPFWAKKFLGHGSSKHNKNQRLYSEPQWIKAGDLSVNDKVYMLNKEFGTKNIDFYIAYLAGRWLGDGWRSDRRSHNNKIYPQFHLCCAYDEVDEVEELFKLANIEYTKDHTPRTAQEYLIRSKPLNKNSNNVQLIDILKKCGKYAHGKKVSRDMFTWNSNSLAALFQGYISADGSNEKREYLTRFSTVSKQLAYDMSVICRMFGKNPSWTEGHDNNNKIEGRTVSTKMYYDIRMYTSDNKNYKTDFDYEDNAIWSSIRIVKHLGASYNVYNLSVENDPSFYADGLLVHNCSALGHSVYGTPGKKPSFICIQMIAEALANVYYWNLLNIKKPEYKLGVRKNNVPRAWSLLIIDEEELKFLEAIELRSMISTIEYSN